MIRVEMARWKQTLEDLRLASLDAPHPRSRERFQALYLIASGQFNATTCAPPLGRPGGAGFAGAPPVNGVRPRRPGVPPHRRPLPPFTEQQVKQIVAAVETTAPAAQGLPGHNWTVKKLKQGVLQTFG